MVALRPDEWKPICSSASRTTTRACADNAAAADKPAIPPPMTRMSGLLTGSGGGQALVHDLAALSQSDRLHDLVVIGQHRASLLLVPERGQEIVEVAGEQGRGVGGERPRKVRCADHGDPVLFDLAPADGALDIAAG